MVSVCVCVCVPQRLETQRANLPDSFTYTILVRAMLVSGRCELVQQVRQEGPVKPGHTQPPGKSCALPQIGTAPPQNGIALPKRPERTRLSVGEQPTFSLHVPYVDAIH